jgi:hypothetical protein
MFKAIILGCALCAGTAGIALWVKSGGNAAADSAAHQPAVESQVSIQDIHRKADMIGLPRQVFGD